MKIAACQFDIAWEDKERNLARLAEFAGSAAARGAGIVFFPEMTLTGFSMNTELTGETGRESVGRVAEIARRHRIAIGLGWVENTADRSRNHYTIVGADGSELSDYVKLHPFSFGSENRHFRRGDDLVMLELGNCRMATFICYDLRFPEVFQAVSKTCSFIVVAANWPAARADHWRTLLRARAIENQVWLLGVNSVGDKGGQRYSGDTTLVDPEGHLRFELHQIEELVTAEIDLGKVEALRAAFPLKSDRRNDLYKELL